MERNQGICLIVTACVLVPALGGVTLAQYGGGSGTPDDPYLIYTPQQLNAIGADPNDWDTHFKLMADIDLSIYTGTEFNMIGTSEHKPFRGTFDGNGYAISNLTLSSRTQVFIGLFGNVRGHDAEIRNLTLINPTVRDNDGLDAVGSLVGDLREATLSYCSVQGGSIASRLDAGGLVGYAFGTIHNCSVTDADVTGSTAGGLIASGGGSLITGCYSTGRVIGRRWAGGLIGSGGGTIANCYSMADVTGVSSVGGLVGWEPSRLVNCYATGTVSGDGSVGGLIGSGQWMEAIEHCFWDIETSGVATSDGGEGKTTAQMQTMATFVSWAQVEEGWIWTIDEGQDYPRLWWEDKPGAPLGPAGALAALSGNGTADDPYLIYTAEEMNLIGAEPDHWDKHYKLMADIDLSRYTGDEFNMIGYYAGWLPVSYPVLPDRGSVPFTGVFDGNGHAIANFRYAGQDRVDTVFGLFGYVDDPNAQIKTLRLIDPDIGPGQGYRVGMGALVGVLGEGTITDCHATGVRIDGERGVGGLVGYNRAGALRGCRVSGIVTGYERVGGLVGYLGPEDPDETGGCHGVIDDCHVEASIVVGGEIVGGLVGGGCGTLRACSSSGTVVGENVVGGLVGYNSEGSVFGCLSRANVVGTIGVGGLAGWTCADVTDCYAEGDVLGETIVGGLVGEHRGSRNRTRRREEYEGPVLANCYATGMVAGLSDVGGLVVINSGTVAQCFWDIETSGQVLSAGGIGRTTAQMQRAETFLSWGAGDGKAIWTVDDGNDYPRLWWEEKPGRPIEAPTLAGAGTLEDPFLIETAQDLAVMGALSLDWGKHFCLVADIDLSEYKGMLGVIGTEATPFTGVFDGDGHTIENLQSAQIADASNVLDAGRGAGLFGCINDPNAVIRNLGLVDPRIDAPSTDDVGALARQLVQGTLSGCFVRGGVVVGRGVVGGLLGSNGGTVTNCYCTSEVIGRRDVAGLTGWNYQTLVNCYSVGHVEGTEYAGGLVAGQDRVRRRSVVEPDEPAGVIACFWDVESSAQTTSDGGTGLTAVEMWMAATFLDAGWDFVGEAENGTEEIWWIAEGQGYPRLWWETAGAEF